MSGHCPCSLVASPLGLRVQEKRVWGEKRHSTCQVLCPEAFLSLSSRGVLGEVPGEGLSRVFTSFPGLSLQGRGPHGLVGARAGVVGHGSWSWCRPWIRCSSGPGAGTQLRPRCDLQGGGFRVLCPAGSALSSLSHFPLFVHQRIFPAPYCPASHLYGDMAERTDSGTRLLGSDSGSATSRLCDLGQATHPLCAGFLPRTVSYCKDELSWCIESH